MFKDYIWLSSLADYDFKHECPLIIHELSMNSIFRYKH